MQVRLSSGNYDIIASDEAFLFDPFEDLMIQVDDGGEVLLRIVLKFQKEPSGERDIKTDIEDDSLVITCINFDGIGTGLRSPTHIADVDGKKVYFIFSSSYFGDDKSGSRSVKYTVFREK